MRDHTPGEVVAGLSISIHVAILRYVTMKDAIRILREMGERKGGGPDATFDEADLVEIHAKLDALNTTRATALTN